MNSVLVINHKLTVGEKVKLLRIAENWRQFDLAYNSHITSYAVSLIERDLEYPKEAMRRIGVCLRVDLLAELEEQEASAGGRNAKR